MSDSAVVDTDRVRYGVIGTGMMGIEHIENILHFDGMRLVVSGVAAHQSIECGRLVETSEVV